jgi:excisionase family DNA binding protein
MSGTPDLLATLSPSSGPGGLPRLLTPDDVADVLQVTTRWVLNAARDGDLPCVKVGRYPRFRPEDVHAFICAGGIAA